MLAVAKPVCVAARAASMDGSSPARVSECAGARFSLGTNVVSCRRPGSCGFDELRLASKLRTFPAAPSWARSEARAVARFTDLVFVGSSGPCALHRLGLVVEVETLVAAPTPSRAEVPDPPSVTESVSLARPLRKATAGVIPAFGVLRPSFRTGVDPPKFPAV